MNRWLRILAGCVITVAVLAGPSSAAGMPTPPPPGVNDCVDQIRLWFPPQAQARMIRAAWGESRWVETAHRPGSQYVGCLQIGTRTHAARLRRWGLTALHMARARWNIPFARLLWNEAGYGPWVATT